MLKLLFTYFTLFFFYLFTPNLSFGQNHTEDINLRNNAEIYFQKAGNFAEKLMIDSCFVALKRSIDYGEKIMSKTSTDSSHLFGNFIRLAFFNEYLGNYTELLDNYNNAYRLLNKSIHPGEISNSSEFTLLKHIMISQVIYLSDYTSDNFKNNLNRLAEILNLTSSKHKNYINIKKYYEVFSEVKSKGLTPNIQLPLKVERLDQMAIIFTDKKIRYKLQIEIVDTLEKLLSISSKKEKEIYNSHLTFHAGNLSYTALFNEDFELSEKMARRAFLLDTRQKWIITNLVHSLYLQDKKEDCKSYYIKYKDIENLIDHKLIGNIIKDDIKELMLNKVCKKDYLSYIEKLDEESKPIFHPKNRKYSPLLPVICQSKKGVNVTINEVRNSYEWTHTESKTKLFGRNNILKKSGQWIIKSSIKNEPEDKFIFDTIYVDESSKPRYMQKLFYDHKFVELPIFRNKINKLEKNFSCNFEEKYKLEEIRTDYVSLDSVAFKLFKNFKPIQDMNCQLVITKSSCICEDSMEVFFKKIEATENGLFLFTYFEENSLEGKIYIRSKLMDDEMPIMNTDPRYNQMLRIQELLERIIVANENSAEQFRALFTNFFLVHPIGGYH